MGEKGVQPRLILVDYVQRVHPERTYDRRREVSEIVERCKDLALQYGCVVGIGSQVARQADERPIPGLPILKDGKETGNLEETADLVWGLWRPIMYLRDGEDIPYSRDGRTVTPTLFSIQCLKQRIGKGVGQGFWLHFAPEYNQFNELAYIDLNEE